MNLDCIQEDTKKKSNGVQECIQENNCLNEGDEDEMGIYGYTKSVSLNVLVIGLYILTLGGLRLVFHWYPAWRLKATHQRCPLAIAQKVLVVDNYEKRFKSFFVNDVRVVSNRDLRSEDGRRRSSEENQPCKTFKIHLSDGSKKEISEFRAVWVKKLCYVWDEKKKSFSKLVGLDRGLTKEKLHQCKGLAQDEQKLRRIAYGNNEILVPIQSVRTLILLEVLNPFYIFQVFTLVVWICENYIYYAFAIIIMSLFGIISAVLETHRNQKSLHDTVHSTDVVTVSRGDGSYQDIVTTELVPGDVIVIPPHGCVMHCDALLLSGNCIVNESMLTGESVPVTKTPLPKDNSLYNEREDANHTLFCGTHILQTRYYSTERVHAVVLRTGFLTTKGNLVRSILYPPPADFKFDQDSYKFIWILASIAFLGFVYTIVSKSSRGLAAGDILLKALDLITIVVPPALPAALSVGKLYALNRLKAHNITCINSRVINVSGSLDCVCFDKTGTLTEDGLDMWGAVPVQDGRFGLPARSVSNIPVNFLLMGMATCHSITRIDGQIVGDPLDVKMFESTGWIFEEPSVPDTSKYDLLVPAIVRSTSKSTEEEPIEIGLIRQYQFSSALQRMSVVTRTLGSKELTVYCKGSPEMIQSLSHPHTVPDNLSDELQQYTQQGYRVIAMAQRTLDDTSLAHLERTSRDQVEKQLNFLGLIVLENRLKPQTAPTISTLKEAQVKVVMVTGDNIQTAVSVAKECGIVHSTELVFEVVAVERDYKSLPSINYVPCGPSASVNYEGFEKGGLKSRLRFAVSGKSWALIREHFPQVIPKLAVRSAIFARMSADQKQQLVLELQQLGYYVAMCGDGANDCGALKAAHVGISLSEAEASVASPFTSKEANISCVPRVIREGRAALVTSFGVFKFMVLYSLVEFFSTMILYSIDSNITDFQFLYIDLALVVNFAFFFGKNEAYPGPLVPLVPLTSLLSLIPIMSLILQIVIMLSIQLVSYYLVHQFSWFQPFQFTNDITYSSYENYAVFSVSQFQYITMAIVFSQGAPYRTSLVSNRLFFASLIIMTAVCCYIVLFPAQWIKSLLELNYPPNLDFPLIILGLGFTNFFVSLFAESFVIQYLMFKKLRYYKHDVTKSRRKYLAIDKSLDSDANWPPVSQAFSTSVHSHINGGTNANHTFELENKIITRL